MENKIIEYYLSYGALDGLYSEDPHQNDTKSGRLIALVNTVHFVNEKPFPLTRAMVVDEKTGEIKLVDCELLKRFKK